MTHDASQLFISPQKPLYRAFLILLHIPIRMIWESVNPGIDTSHRLPVRAGDSALFTNEHLFFLASSLLVLVGLFLIAFSKEKIEDEQISQLRLDSLRWAIYLNYFILLLSLVFTNGIDFIDILRLNLMGAADIFYYPFQMGDFSPQPVIK